MPVDILVPPLSQTSDSLHLLEWLKKPGDKVVKGEALFTVETDKASLEVESPESGTLFEVYAKPQTEITVRSVIGKILREGETFPQKSEADKAEPQITEEIIIQVESAPVEQKAPVDSKSANRLFASPRARKLANEKNFDLSHTVPTGMRGMVVERDARLLMEKAQPTARTESAPMSHIRQVIAKRMLESHQGTVPVSYMRETDATGLVTLRNQVLVELSESDIRPTFTDFFIHIVCVALMQHPQMNSTFENGQLILNRSVNLALAVDTDRGLIVPVLRDTDQLTVRQIANQRKVIVEKAMSGSVTPDELTGGTFTLSNLGTLGIDFFTPIINPPQVAILGIGRIRESPAVKDGEIYIRSVVGLALTCDHRVIDGAPAARFLETLNQLIENPSKAWM
ncbi:MAG: dihydrolipoamide acetyltransferase family protein [Pelolinea sp.]|nr:dihydrolipoamide acetyltransferase family protein [Pelolinea sp.]